MTKADLLEIIANGESSGVEFKRDDVRPEQLAKEVVALANLQGGQILLGVDDDGNLPGIQRTDLERWVMDTVFGRHVHPMILPFYEEIDMGGGKRVAVITISTGSAKPYVLRHNDREDIYVRVGSLSRLASREQQVALMGSSNLLHIESLPVSGTGVVDLDEARLIDYLSHITGDDRIPASKEEWERRLLGLGFMTGQEGRVLCTIAGLVLFGRAPRRAFRYAGVRWMSFSSQEMEYQAQDDTVLDGPLVPRVAINTTAASDMELGLPERLLGRMYPFVSTEAARIDESLRRTRSFKYPLEAMREAIINALVHRDWSLPSEVEVVNYLDRLEVKSPGPLQNSMTVEKMLAGQRSPRNPIIVEVMRDYGYVDARGMGVRRKIVPLVREASGKEARFEATDDYLRVALPARQHDKNNH